MNNKLLLHFAFLKTFSQLEFAQTKQIFYSCQKKGTGSGATWQPLKWEQNIFTNSKRADSVTIKSCTPGLFSSKSASQLECGGKKGKPWGNSVIQLEKSVWPWTETNNSHWENFQSWQTHTNLSKRPNSSSKKSIFSEKRKKIKW